jgi:pilus assembly protein CpaF
VHANSAFDAMIRLESLAMSGDSQVSEKAVRAQIASAVDIIVQISRYPDGSRRIASITEVLGMTEQGAYEVEEIFKLSSLTREADGKLVGQLQPTGKLPTFFEEIENNRIPFGRDKFVPSKVA